MNLTQEIVYYSKLCYYNKFLSATDGNISARTGSGSVLITASNTCKGFITQKDVIETDINGKRLRGKRRISTEFKLHSYIYRQRREINAVIHTHPVFATAFAAAGIALDKIVFPEIYLFFGKIPLAKYSTPSTDEVPESISRLVNKYDAIMLANHGLVTFGKSLEEAYYKTEKAEHIAGISFYARLLGGEKELTKAQVKKLDNIKQQIANSK